VVYAGSRRKCSRRRSEEDEEEEEAEMAVAVVFVAVFLSFFLCVRPAGDYGRVLEDSFFILLFFIVF
jgi:hypothetical protein